MRQTLLKLNLPPLPKRIKRGKEKPKGSGKSQGGGNLRRTEATTRKTPRKRSPKGKCFHCDVNEH